ncbi:MAG: hypothetical protein QXH96_01180 [Candidatus Geothermarchaeota archaeon]
MKETFIYILCFITSLILTKLFLSLFVKLNLTGIDIFKAHRPRVPLLGGLSIPLTIMLYTLIGVSINVIQAINGIAILLSIATITAIGLLDDLYDLPGFYKPLFCTLGGLPLILLQTYEYHLQFPLGVGFRISIIYALLILVGVSVAANTFNMLDVINGSATVGGVTSLIALFFAASIFKINEAIFPIMIGIATYLGFLVYNLYPARTFLGNAPALAMGAYIAVLSIIYSIEFPAVVSLFPFIHNSFFVLQKIRGFVEHKKLNYQVTYLSSEELIYDAHDPNAPITLLRLLVSKKPLREYEALLNIIILCTFSCILSIISTYLMIKFEA